MSLTPGLCAEIRTVVTEADTATNVGSGDVPVLATPRLLALMEEATVAAIAGALRPGRTSVGAAVSLSHDAASPVGAELVVTAELTEIDGRRLTFTATARDGGTLAGSARIERVTVDRDRFVAGATR